MTRQNITQHADSTDKLTYRAVAYTERSVSRAAAMKCVGARKEMRVPIFRSSSCHGSRTRGPRDDGFEVDIIRSDLDHTSESPAEWGLGSSCRRFELEVLLLKRKEKRREEEEAEIPGRVLFYYYALAHEKLTLSEDL